VTDTVTSHRLAVAWQHPVTRAMTPVGMLTAVDGRFTFAYLRRACDVDGFQPFLGFSDWDGHYESERLFPLFAQRAMRPSRPDYSRYLRSLRLPADSTDWAILGRSQGSREGDGIRLFPEPLVDEDGATRSTFFVNGLRHRMAQDPAVGLALDRLRQGQELRIVEEPDNPVDQRALLVTPEGGVALAWVPSLMLDYVHEVRATGATKLVVEAVNGDDVPAGYRLLVTLSGRLPVGSEPFSGPDWEVRVALR
jgi:hypothetical protein